MTAGVVGGSLPAGSSFLKTPELTKTRDVQPGVTGLLKYSLDDAAKNGAEKMPNPRLNLIRKITEKVTRSSDEVFHTLQELVRIPSVVGQEGEA